MRASSHARKVQQVEATTSAAPPPRQAEAEARFARQFIRPMLTIGDACGLHDAIHLLRPKTIVALRSEWSPEVDGEPGRAKRPAEDTTRPDLVVALDVMNIPPDPA